MKTEGEGAAGERERPRHPAIPYVAPFAVFLALLAGDRFLPLAPELNYALRFLVVFGLLMLFSRRVISWRVSHFAGSTLLGLAVFAIWVGPDVLWPAYRESWFFNNVLVGAPKSSLPAGANLSRMFLLFRVLASVINVPILEELFWRGWMMRWLIARDFAKVPLGTYAPGSFWLVAVLFASEHGAFWDVGLIAGIVYNWWIVRTRSLGDCILAHAVTNACLAVYVVGCGRWQYWL
ncbi:MAG TPA: CAAX prenyl protease-related protein [Bryobacteraceae bacterium]|nr:CAAX prenyl protease-related protein [Bryobacteraceae bacterium]